MKMKKIMLLASGIFFALAPLKILAQEDGVNVVGLAPVAEMFNDTLVIKLRGSDKILLIGKDLKQMVKYQKADSMKQLFISDFEKALNNHSINKEVQLVHYFIHGSGKRRIKAENPEYSDNRIDPAYEIKRLDLDLPKYQYIIHDLNSGYEIQIYMNDPDELKAELNSVNLYDAIHFAGNDKKILRRTYKLEMTGENNVYKITGKTHGRQDVLSLGPTLGVGVLGNVIAPVAGADLTLSLTDKYSVGKYKFGLGYEVFPFANNIVSGEVSSLSWVQTINLKFLTNINAGTKDKAYWMGLQGGSMKSSNMISYNNAFEFGILIEGNGAFNYSFDFIRDKEKTLYGLTVKFPF